MLAYVYGPNQTFSNFDKQFVQTQFATAANKVLQDCYFGGAAPENGYKPDEPITITLEEGPYFIKAANGKPERHMSLIYFAGADTERYMDVFKSSGGTWYAYESNYKHLLASVKEPTGTAPAESGTTTTAATTTTTKATTTTTAATTPKATTTTTAATTPKATTTTTAATTPKATTTTTAATTPKATTTQQTTTVSVTSVTGSETTPAQTTTLPEPAFVRGDVNGDGKVGVDDAQAALIAYTEQFAGNPVDLTDAQRKAVDVNEDGVLNVDDAQNILIFYTESKVAGKEITWEDLLEKKPQARPVQKKLPEDLRLNPDKKDSIL